RGDRPSALARMAAYCSVALRAESCAIFLIAETDRDTLRFEAAHPATLQTAWVGAMLSIPQYRSSWLGEAAFNKRPLRLGSADLSGVRIALPHPLARTPRSILAVPLLDRRGNARAVLE